jgi:hypothetical protein
MQNLEKSGKLSENFAGRKIPGALRRAATSTKQRHLESRNPRRCGPDKVGRHFPPDDNFIDKITPGRIL